MNQTQISNQALFDRLIVRALHVYQKKGTSEQHVYELMFNRQGFKADPNNCTFVIANKCNNKSNSTAELTEVNGCGVVQY